MWLRLTALTSSEILCVLLWLCTPIVWWIARRNCTFFCCMFEVGKMWFSLLLKITHESFWRWGEVVQLIKCGGLSPTEAVDSLRWVTALCWLLCDVLLNSTCCTEVEQTSSGRQAGREVTLSYSACLLGLLIATMKVGDKWAGSLSLFVNRLFSLPLCSAQLYNKDTMTLWYCESLSILDGLLPLFRLLISFRIITPC